MRIEKINDTQIRVTLSHSDLNPRDIEISELAYGSKKAQELFRDMMTQAYEQFGFETENIPLMIEAVPLSKESIMVVITKVEDPRLIDNRLQGMGDRPTHRTFKDDFSNLFELNSDGEAVLNLNKISKPNKTDESKSSKTAILVYSFSSLQGVTDAGHKINQIYCGMNSLYKQDDKTYFLVLQPNFMHTTTRTQLESVLDDFGVRHVSSPLSESFLMEHTTLLIKDNALEILTTYL